LLEWLSLQPHREDKLHREFRFANFLESWQICKTQFFNYPKVFRCYTIPLNFLESLKLGLIFLNSYGTQYLLMQNQKLSGITTLPSVLNAW
jgi:hypothetical protein